MSSAMTWWRRTGEASDVRTWSLNSTVDRVYCTCGSWGGGRPWSGAVPPKYPRCSWRVPTWSVPDHPLSQVAPPVPSAPTLTRPKGLAGGCAWVPPVLAEAQTITTNTHPPAPAIPPLPVRIRAPPLPSLPPSKQSRGAELWVQPARCLSQHSTHLRTSSSPIALLPKVARFSRYTQHHALQPRVLTLRLSHPSVVIRQRVCACECARLRVAPGSCVFLLVPRGCVVVETRLPTPHHPHAPTQQRQRHQLEGTGECSISLETSCPPSVQQKKKVCVSRRTTSLHLHHSA